MARVVQQIKLLVNGAPSYCVYMGTKEENDADITGGKGHLVVICPGGTLAPGMLAHRDGSAFELNAENTVSKIKVRDAYRLEDIPYADIIPDIVDPDEEEE
ncbi:hypothetical protein LPAF129_17060 [Ligilactobacillus pabuli]|uniref:Uncharacterized protein n=1 Tax=Ligilactobacillus pabuli TaxID=2886039 RepID=A0ABQ5JMU2_9LACO|nr:hypothetical protein [Ligilactobacillus pabuli]GKS82020.1 hypothetical protein LPAF129_17060 [Ligilactobacillus pabuli]HIW89380.1 hypothetical protein [Candidatus Ligilactobacillus excrementipullorum]